MQDVMQICLAGHTVTAQAKTSPSSRRPFCKICGEPTITDCPSCNAPIPGPVYMAGVPRLGPVFGKAPQHCERCGMPYPWKITAVANAIEILQMDMDEVDHGVAADLVKAASKENPSSEVAALKLKRLLQKGGVAAYDVGIKVVADVLSATAKKAIGIR